MALARTAATRRWRFWGGCRACATGPRSWSARSSPPACSSVIDFSGYVRFRDWRIYGEEGLAKREAAIWLHEKTLTLEHAGQALSRYDVEYAPGGSREAEGKLAAVARPRLFETLYTSAQLRLFGLDALGESGWLKAMRLEDYAPRKARHPQALQDVLFPYLDAL